MVDDCRSDLDTESISSANHQHTAVPTLRYPDTADLMRGRQFAGAL
ncbi:hypothetical protein BPODLACK_00192 [Gordonia sp. YY1]|nr:hypothetical protein BPODLACK_00192 [Gordonia sp. YY1]